MNISIFYEKQNTYKILRNLTYHIGNVSADLKEISENREDIEIAKIHMMTQNILEKRCK